MSTFFDDRAPSVNLPEPEAPWDTEIGRGVPLTILLARTRAWALTASGFIAYSSGFEFDVIMVRRRPPAPGSSRGRPWNPPRLELFDGNGRQLPLRGGGGGGSDDHMRWGIRCMAMPRSGPLRLAVREPAWAVAEVELDAGPLLDRPTA